VTGPVRPPRRRVLGIPLGRIGGIPVVIAPSWVVSVVIIAVLATPVVEQSIRDIGRGGAVGVSVALGVLLGASVLAHELGHCLAARSLGVAVTEVRLYLLGGVSTLGRLPDSPREEATIAAAGPGVSAILAGIFGLLVGSSTPHTVGWLLLIELALANLVVAIFNFLPALPLDGGRVLRAGVWQASGHRRHGTLAAVIGGYVIALAMLIWGTVQLTGSSRAGLLQGGIAVMMALFVGVGAAAERNSDRAVQWPSDAQGPLSAAVGRLALPVVQLPFEVSVGMALQAAAGRAVVLTRIDGTTAGLMDNRAALELARSHPGAPAGTVARAIPPEMVLFAHDGAQDLADRVGAGRSGDHFLLVDDAGRPTGVVSVDDLARILARRPGS
jgi:Zn-dependent protease